MGAHGHGHEHGHDSPAVAVGTTARTALLAALAAALVATVVGVIVLWPHDDALTAIRQSGQYAAAGVTFPEATVTRVGAVCPDGDQSGSNPSNSTPSNGDRGCGTIDVRVDEGEGRGTQQSVPVGPEVLTSSLAPGDVVQLTRTPGQGAGTAEATDASFSYLTTERGVPLAWLAVGFALIVLAVARLRGLMALVSLAAAAVAVWRFTLPALLTGESGTAVALVSAAAIMFVVLYATHGVSLRTSAALAGTLAGVAVTAGLGLLVIDGAHLTGVADETGGYLTQIAGGLDFRGLLSAGLVIAGLGVLNDVTVTQASAVWELRAAGPGSSRRSVFAAAMRIGRDHIASTIYTIVFAYAGTALVTLLLLQVYDRPLIDLLSSEELAEEVARTLTSGIGLVLAVPLTTAVAALVAGPTGGPGGSGGSGGSRGAATSSPRPTRGGKRRAPGRGARGRRSHTDWDLEEAHPSLPPG